MTHTNADIERILREDVVNAETVEDRAVALESLLTFRSAVSQGLLM